MPSMAVAIFTKEAKGAPSAQSVANDPKRSPRKSVLVHKTGSNILEPDVCGMAAVSGEAIDASAVFDCLSIDKGVISTQRVK